ncbi:MAG: AAA family ATPase, partial [Bacteroidales bacterium]|nr:AAA family ATPase [Bacteroidales bacterium]
MENLIEKSLFNINSIKYPYQRNIKGNIDWKWRMNGIIGARGVGKTTLLLQKLKQLQTEDHEVLYVRLDDFYFTENRVYDLAEEFRKMGGEYLFLDEVHKYYGWARELKNIYDAIPG